MNHGEYNNEPKFEMGSKDYYIKDNEVFDRNRTLIIHGKKDSPLDFLVLPISISLFFGCIGLCLRPYSEKAFLYYSFILAAAIIICSICSYKKQQKDEPPKPIIITKDEIAIDWFTIPWDKVDHCSLSGANLKVFFTEPINDFDDWSVYLPFFNCSQDQLRRAIEFYSQRQLFGDNDKGKVGVVGMLFLSILSAVVFTGLLYLIIKMI